MQGYRYCYSYELQVVDIEKSVELIREWFAKMIK